MDYRIAQRYATIIKHKSQTCKVFELKIVHSHLSKKDISHLEAIFREAKWFYNYCLSHKDIKEADTKAKSVPVKVGEEFEDREFTALSSQVKQGIHSRIFGSLKSLHALKENGNKVGKLKFKSYVNSIPLKQFNNTHFIQGNRIRLQGMKKWLKVKGLEQIPKDTEIANATLVKKDKDYYLLVTTYQIFHFEHVPEVAVGIDFGCETQLTFSNGVKVQFQVEPSKRLRKLDRKIMKGNRKKSNNKRKDQALRRKEYLHLTNKKSDIRHKLVNVVTKQYRYVCYQDESIHAWAASGHGKKIQFTGIGGILADLKHKSATPLEVNKFFPSTQLCPDCNAKQKLELSDRVYNCPCGFIMDRDIKSAICIEAEGLKQIPMECRKFTLGEISTSTFFEKLSKISGVKVSKPESLSQEAPTL